MVVCYNAAVALLQYGDTLLFGYIIFGLGATIWRQGICECHSIEVKIVAHVTTSIFVFMFESELNIRKQIDPCLEPLF